MFTCFLIYNTVLSQISFEDVGGLDHHIRALKEMVVFPLLYPEVFEKFSISPPRGVLFYGPPGMNVGLKFYISYNKPTTSNFFIYFFNLFDHLQV